VRSEEYIIKFLTTYSLLLTTDFFRGLDSQDFLDILDYLDKNDEE